MNRFERIQQTISLVLYCGFFAAGAAPSVLAASSVSLPVPALTIYPGEVISAEMLRQKRFRASYMARRKAYKSRDRVLGMQAKRTLLRGKPIPLNGLQPPYLVRKGALIQVIYEKGGLSIQLPAVALRSASAGEVIQARNQDTGKIISGLVTSAGKLQMSDAQ